MADKEIIRQPSQTEFPNITTSGMLFLRDLARWVNNVIARIVVIETVEEWTAPTLLNGWVNYGVGFAPAGYSKDSSGRVHLRGLVKSGTAVFDTPIFVLPEGYRPAYQVVSSVESGGIHGRTDVKADGSVVFQSGLNNYHQIGNISFLAEV